MVCTCFSEWEPYWDFQLFLLTLPDWGAGSLVSPPASSALALDKQAIVGNLEKQRLDVVFYLTLLLLMVSTGTWPLKCLAVFQYVGPMLLRQITIQFNGWMGSSPRWHIVSKCNVHISELKTLHKYLYHGVPGWHLLSFPCYPVTCRIAHNMVFIHWADAAIHRCKAFQHSIPPKQYFLIIETCIPGVLRLQQHRRRGWKSLFPYAWCCMVEEAGSPFPTSTAAFCSI